MLGVTLETQKKLKERGYQFIESMDGAKAVLIKGKKVFARFKCNEDGILELKVRDETQVGITAVSIKAVVSPETVMLEIERRFAKGLWCEIPVKEGHPVFWEK